VTGILKFDAHAWVERARADVLRTSRELLEADEHIETLRRSLAQAQSTRGWIALSHRAATIDLRNAEAMRSR
jgi:hypothetical protein